MRRGARVAAPLFPAAAALGASFSVLGAGGGVAAAVVAALLLNARYVPIGITVAQSFRGSLLKRFAEAQLVVDESWALAGGGTARFDRRVLLGVGGLLWVAWVSGTAIGALAGQAIGDPSAFGLDGAFAALFVALLAAQLTDRRRIAAAIGGGAIAALLIPFTPPGIPIIAATAAVAFGWTRG
jgi:predicted branched-subunit amino acid permease